MPLYAYQCTSCDATFDSRQSIAQRDNVTCPQCEATATRLLASINILGSSSPPEPIPACGQGTCEARQTAGFSCPMAS